MSHAVGRASRGNMNSSPEAQQEPAMRWQREIEDHILAPDALLHVFTHMCKVATDSKSLKMEHISLLSSGHKEIFQSTAPVVNTGRAPTTQQRKSKHSVHPETTQPHKTDTDPITLVVTTMLTEPLHFVLSETGASFFRQHTSCSFPYHLMSLDQKRAIQRCLQNKDEWKILNSHIVFKGDKHASKTKHYKLNPTTCLKTLCRAIMSSKTVENKANLIALCNIILQRTHTHLPVSNTAQRELVEFSQKLMEQ